MIEVFDEHYLLLALLLSAGTQALFALPAVLLETDRVTDFSYGSGFGVLALVTYFLSETRAWRCTLVLIFVCVWATRLALFLAYRVAKMKRDKRFDTMRNDPLKFLGFWVIQMISVFVVSVPFVLLNSKTTHESAVTGTDIAGIVLYGIGLGMETLADHQKFMFKLKFPQRLVTQGIWSWSRFPNYVGEMMVWWGIWLLCIADFTDANEYATVLCPLYISGLLLFVSGVPTVEPEQQKRYGHLREYWQWRLGTSKYVPMPPSWYYSVLPYNDDDVEEGMSAMHAHGQHP